MRQPELRSVPGLLSAQELQATVDAIAAAQQPTRSLPWSLSAQLWALAD